MSEARNAALFGFPSSPEGGAHVVDNRRRPHRVVGARIGNLVHDGRAHHTLIVVVAVVILVRIIQGRRAL